ncbi:methyl-accepting chemotaxis protein [Gemmobacter denitrificans]|uniref:Methyl-accepting chemotaxis protein n=1 Tax=Gemmobacter denitrificans TaxID=3123040 RepID=A0ABU8BR97_9RHOB
MSSIAEENGMNMRLIWDLRVRTQIALMLVLPAVALVFFATLSSKESLQTANNMEKLQVLAAYVGNVGDAVHALQIERVRSSLFINSSGKDGKQELLGARKATDVALDAKKRKAVEAGVDAMGGELQSLYEENLRILGQLAETREAISTLRFTASESFHYYSGAIDALMSNPYHVARSTDDAQLALKFDAFTIYLNAKENADQERSVASSSLNLGHFRPAAYQLFLQVVAAQETYLQLFKRKASPELVGMHDSTVAGEAVNEVAMMRGEIVDNALGGELTGVTAETWFQATTERINQMRLVEDGLTADIVAYAAALGAESRRAFVKSAAMAALALGATVLIALVLGLKITAGLKRTVEQTRRLADGDLDIQITGVGRRNELGDLANALEVFRKNAHEARRLQAEAEAMRHEDAARQQSEMAKQERVVGDISAGLERLAAGDLSRPIDSPPNNPFPPEYDALRNTYNSVIQQLSRTVSRIGSVAASVRGGSDEIASVAQNLSSRAQTQAATLEQSAAALNELTESVRSTAQHAKAARKASQENHAHAETGAQIVVEAMDAMRGIEQSSEQITRIIGVIDEIAFQTNLLALNTGVEAARAGEAGRGFAVVASEVRALAQRASESAHEIKALIRQSTEQVEVGSTLVGRTGDSLSEILKRASDVSALIAEIAAAVSEQASGLDEINTGVHQLDQVTQQNAAVAEETTAVAATLLHKADELTAELSGFQTAGGSSVQASVSSLHSDRKPRFHFPDARTA